MLRETAFRTPPIKELAVVGLMARPIAPISAYRSARGN
jgi:hypothetical protein